MSEATVITELATLFAEKVLDLAREHGIILALLSGLGLLSIISAIGSKCYQLIRLIFMFVVAVPAIIIVGLINKDERKKRLKELGEIKAHLKEKPERWKRVMYYFLFTAFLVIIGIVLYWIMINFIFPIQEFNEASKTWLENSTNTSI